MTRFLVAIFVIGLVISGINAYIESKVDPPAVVVGKFMQATTKVSGYLLDKKTDFSDPPEDTRDLFVKEKDFLAASTLFLFIFNPREYKITREGISENKAEVEVELLIEFLGLSGKEVSEEKVQKYIFRLKKSGFFPTRQWLVEEVKVSK
jgi:hypothetical protein